ncbi:hypothetical protein ASPWEDRAFT_506765 [Aspergillus wentii DTO 134E9]|uniref:D-alanine--D-alanine ligase C-terminal domain-containing protein n=1 Tax=Aspergillus wentii DTO 134E9 TaxID=1073089 RepID=A0A1L9RKC4_ASPWE|nr:uncharacterized protein ASPWEDRAFT_506765 [Aspergillus wentii DTO 134E9]OJJ35365.1 hypothetical protein ASPWEDRAFT_506765 [Aspergillus wentii DTO 134E9]
MDPDAELAFQVALKEWTVLGCRDGGQIDIRLDSSSGKQVANVMEINPLAGLRPGWSQLPIIAENNGVSFDDVNNHIFQSAMKRINAKNEHCDPSIYRAISYSPTA